MNIKFQTEDVVLCLPECLRLQQDEHDPAPSGAPRKNFNFLRQPGIEFLNATNPGSGQKENIALAKTPFYFTLGCFMFFFLVKMHRFHLFTIKII